MYALYIFGDKKGCVSMANLNKKIKLGKKGVNYVTDIVDSNNSNFNNIIQENDIGTDGMIEVFTKSGTPTSKLIAVQIKTGKSYYNEQTKLCTIPIETHREYWERTPLPFFGIVCIVNSEEDVIDAYWVNIKEYLYENKSATNIRFEMTDYNRFSKEDFYYGFCSQFIFEYQIKELTFSDCEKMIDEGKYSLLALNALAVYHSNILKSWDIIFSFYEHKSPLLDLAFFYEAISYAFSHPDHFVSNHHFRFSEESKLFVVKKINSFEENDIEDMLSFIDGTDFKRGSIAQTIEIIIDKIDNSSEKVFNVIKANPSLAEYGMLIIAYHDIDFFISKIEDFNQLNFDISQYIIEQYTLNEGLYLY